MSITDDFKNSMACWASGVAVVTTKARDLCYGLTVSSFTSVSLNPPLILVSLSSHNRLQLMIQDAQTFGVSILHRDMEEASNYFASPGREPTPGFVEIDGHWTDSGVPVVKNAMAHVVCKLHDVVVWGDHTVIAGEVVEVDVPNPSADPLVYFNRGYRSIATEAALDE